MSNDEQRRAALKGNFTPEKSVTVPEAPQNLRTRFEGEALKHLGGSIAFVSGKKFVYGAKKAGEKGPA